MFKQTLTLLFILIASFVSAQNTDTAFEKQWIEIDTLIISQNLPKTALQKVNELYKKANEKHLDVQAIKCLVYRISLEDRVFDNKPNNAIILLEDEIKQTENEVAKSILHSLLANRYYQYYNNQRWQVYNRSKTIGFKKEDIETWNADDFGKSISDNYSKSIEAAKALQQVKLSAYDAIILKGNARKLRPTLFDLLAHEALNYFKTGDYYLTKPTYVFALTDINSLASAMTFVNTRFETKDSTSHLLKSLELFKQLIKFHLNDEDKNALIDVDLERVQWVRANLTNENKENQYRKTLESIASYTFLRASQANYLLAQLDADLARLYQPFGDTTRRFNYNKALEIIDNALLKYKGEDEGISNLKSLRQDILQKSISTKTEKVNIPNKPFRSLATYKNVDSLFVRLIKKDKDNKDFFEGRSGDFDDLSKQKTYKAFVQPLPQTRDHQLHSVEIKIDALPAGEYVLLTSNGAGFVDSLNKMSRENIYVSNISYLKNGDTYFVLNRETGEALNNVKVEIFKQQWNSATSKNENILVEEKKSDKNGMFVFKPKDNNGNYRFSFTSKNDQLYLSDYEYLYNYNRSNDNDDDDYDKDEARDYEVEHANIFFFTDRSIYRPSQTVYFKGIAITKDFKTKQNKVLAGKDSILVHLQDANNQDIDSLYLKTNEYGSFSGKFILPQNVLTGEFEIIAEDFERSNIRFSVEEYKRPKFYVEFEKVKGSYRLNDSVTVSGMAKAYAGNGIDGAQVKFNVQRKARFVYDWLFRGASRPSSGNLEISEGEIVTDAQGKFKVTFKALADEKIDKKTDPLFDFSINADVTDINGETRSSNALLTVGYKSLVLNITVPKIAEADSLKQLSLTTKNLSNEKEPAEVTIKIYPLQTPQRLIRKRLWQRADQFVMNEATYISNFPNDEYADELNENLWIAGPLIAEQKINTDSSSSLNIQYLKLSAGYYKIEATTKDKYGNDIKDVKFMQLFSREAAPYPQYNFSYTINNYAEPNETAQFIAGSMADKIMVIRKTEKPYSNKKEKMSYSFNTYKKGLHSINYKAAETDRGNVGISEAFIINNRVYTNQFNVNVPYSNKALQVNYTSYRNKTEPGNKETWTVNIKGSKGEKVAAELLTSMYDASLDQFKQQSWNQPNIWQTKYIQNQFTATANFNISQSYENYRNYRGVSMYQTNYDRLLTQVNFKEYIIRREMRTMTLQGKVAGLQVNANGTLDDVIVVGYGTSKKSDLTGAVSNIKIRGSSSVSSANALYVVDGIPMEKGIEAISPNDIASLKVIKDAAAIAIYGARGANGVIVITTKNGAKQLQEKQAVQPRKNFNETAFFFPNLYADTAGNYSFSFTIPEALTQWKWLSFAHTKDLAFGTNSTTITTQKTLMVQPNAPRFMREGDNMEFVAKVSNLSDKELTGQATLELVDAVTGTSVDGWFQNIFPNQYFTVAAGQSAAVKFPIQIPFSYNKPLTWRVVARAGEFGDGEENTLPVLTNRMLVTETLPLYLKSGEKEKSFTFDKLLNNKSESLTHEGITVEYTANPIWSIVQSLPYLMEYPYECAEQTFNRFYANALAASIVGKYPNIKMMFEKWKNDTTALKSNLQKNEELKQVLLQETPWVLNAESEEQQKKNIALLFDVVKMSNSMESVIEKLKQMQLESGGFAWFKGGNEDRYITNYILTGIGKLKKINAISKDMDDKLAPIITKALRYLDTRIEDDYNWLVKNKVDLKKDNLSSTAIQYLFMRSFYADIKVNEGITTANNYYYNQAKQYWNKQNSYNAAMIGLVLYRNNERRFVNVNILPSITENAVEDTAKGTLYWKERNTCFWYASPIEHQSMMIEFLNEVANKEGMNDVITKVDAAKTWLILNKQTNNWKTTSATADACYALLDTGSKWAQTSSRISINIGNTRISNPTVAEVLNRERNSVEGNIKERIAGNEIKNEMGNIKVVVDYSYRTPSYGSIYWQYFEDLDKITEAASPLSIKKKIFIERNTDKGKVLELVSDTNQLKVGDKLIVRMELRSDREMEYLHLKDMRASGTEPINVLSGYKWQEGLGYYEATKDASTNFFIDHMQKGTYVFEYPLYITHTGTFSMGIATIQCMYAPEFTSHSEGIKITVK